jgi:hypothetical protein
MPLSQTLPAALRHALAAINHGEQPVISAATNLTCDGCFGEEWLVITGERLLVFAPNGGTPEARLDIRLADIKAPRADALVGGGAAGDSRWAGRRSDSLYNNSTGCVKVGKGFSRGLRPQTPTLFYKSCRVLYQRETERRISMCSANQHNAR